MSSVTKAALIVLAVGVALTVLIYSAVAVSGPSEGGANIGAGIGVLFAISFALIGAVITVIGFILDRVAVARKLRG